MKDTRFYNNESERYSSKRYPEQSSTFTHYFFKKRLNIALARTAHLMRKGMRVLEVGCADGVVARAVAKKGNGMIERFDAIDLSPEMIRVAEEQTPSECGIVYAVREDYTLSGSYNLILELGVLNYLDIVREIPSIAAALTSGGTYLCSVAGNSSIQYRLKGGEYEHIWPYAAYESLFSEHFILIRKDSVGFFVPWLWKSPGIARRLQPLVEYFGSLIKPQAALEIVYELKKRT